MSESTRFVSIPMEFSRELIRSKTCSSRKGIEGSETDTPEETIKRNPHFQQNSRFSGFLDVHF